MRTKTGRPQGHIGVLALVAVVLMIVSAGCGSAGPDDGRREQPSASSPKHRSVAVVAIGDSDATGIGDETKRGWVGRYSDLLHTQLASPVTTDNRAAEGKTSDQLRSEVAQDGDLRKNLAEADVVLIGIGGADLNAGDDALSAGRCHGNACYAELLREFAENITAIASTVRRLAPSATIRAITLPNVYPGAGAAIPAFITPDIARYQVTSERTATCRAMTTVHGRCVDVPRAFNGPAADDDAYATGLLTKDPCCYASGKGQQLIARLLIATGVDARTDLP
jgi:lysophospholipase L1-like esterase